jgi:hypothetical protein
MKWFKHNGNALHDEKIEELIDKYSMEGYGVYFAIVEMIAGALSTDNIDFDLKHRATTLSRKWNMKRSKIIEITDFLTKINLLQINPETNNIACFGLLKRLDVSTSNNIEFKKMVNNNKYQKLLESNSRREDNTIEEKRKEDIIKPPKKDKFLDFILLFEYEYDKLVEDFGEHKTKEYIQRLNDYIGSKGVKYKSHYHTILNWRRKDEKDRAINGKELSGGTKEKDEDVARRYTQNPKIIKTED